MVVISIWLWFFSLSLIPNSFYVTADSSVSELRDLTYWERHLRDYVNNEFLASTLHFASNYKKAQPFPHMVASSIFPKQILKAVCSEIPEHQNVVDDCVVGGECHNDGINEKARTVFGSPSSFGPATEALYTFMQSPIFIRYLQSATGIEDLVSGSNFQDSGLQQTLHSGFEKVHTDFNMDRPRSLHRRLNVFLYLNPDWRDEYGGHLELWSTDLKHCEARISPDLGKLVVFSSTDFSYHGHQSPLTCPEDRSRRSLSMYYYTKTRPSSECLDNNCLGTYHTTLFQKTLCSDCSEKMCYASTA